MKRPDQEPSRSPRNNARSMAPHSCYDDVNVSSAEEHLEALGNNNLLRGNARARIYRSLFPFTPKSIADIGCGVGITTSALKHAFSDAVVCGYDISESAVAYAARADRHGAEYRVVEAGVDVRLERQYEAMVFQEFYPFTQTPDFNIHLEFLRFAVNNLAPGGFIVIQLAIRHPETTILVNGEQLEDFCETHQFDLTRHMIPFDRLVDITTSVWISKLLTPALAFLTGADRRIVLLMRHRANRL